MIITIPFKTPSINHLHGHNKFGAFYLRPEAKKLREEIKEICHNFNSEKLNEKKLKVITEIYEDWLTKKGLIKRVDVSNREKFLIDSVFDAINIDDKFIFEHTMKKVQSDQEFAIVKIEVFE